MSRRSNSEERLRDLRLLANELARANTHYYFGEILHANLQKLGEAHVFWEYTVTAHVSTAFRHLCVVYDYNNKGINLIKCLKSIDERTLDQAKQKQLGDYVGLCGQKSQDHWVQSLRAWRNKIVAHYNEEAALDREGFDKDNPDEPSEILRNLIDSGFKILEWCSGLHGRPATYPRFARGKESCAAVLKCLQI